ncbi:cupin, partial [Sulfolobus sp. F1]
DLQTELKNKVKDILKEIENEDLKVVIFMEHTSPPKKVQPKLIKFSKVLPLLEMVAEEGTIEKGVAKVMFYSTSTERNRGLTPTMMAGFQLIKPRHSTKPHSHNMASIYLVVKGRGYSIVGDKKLEWESGDVFVVPANEIHYHVNIGEDYAILFDVTDSGLIENLGILEFKEEDK